MTTMMAIHHIVGIQCGTNANRYSFLANPEMRRRPHLLFAIFARKRSFRRADEKHLLIEVGS